jgi:hypothetical protein
MSTSCSSLFGDLKSIAEMRPLVSDVFPSPSSLYCFVRHNREELAESGALLDFNGELRFRPQQFAEAATKIAARRAK